MRWATTAPSEIGDDSLVPNEIGDENFVPNAIGCENLAPKTDPLPDSRGRQRRRWHYRMGRSGGAWPGARDE
jgi:hypothetical protein